MAATAASPRRPFSQSGCKSAATAFIYDGGRGGNPFGISKVPYVIVSATTEPLYVKVREPEDEEADGTQQHCVGSKSPRSL